MKSPSSGWFPVVAGLYAFVGGTLTVLGRMLDVPLLSDLDGDGIAMQPNAGDTAILGQEAIVQVYAPINVLWQQNERFHNALNWYLGLWI